MWLPDFERRQNRGWIGQVTEWSAAKATNKASHHVDCQRNQQTQTSRRLPKQPTKPDITSPAKADAPMI